MKILSALTKEEKLYNFLQTTFGVLGSVETSVVPSEQTVVITLVHPNTINLINFSNIFKALNTKNMTAQYNPKQMKFSIYFHKYKNLEDLDFYDLARLNMNR